MLTTLHPRKQLPDLAHTCKAMQGRIQDFGQGGSGVLTPGKGPEPKICSKLPKLHDFEKKTKQLGQGFARACSRKC